MGERTILFRIGLDDQIQSKSKRCVSHASIVAKAIKVSSLKQTVAAFTKEVFEEHWLMQSIQSAVREEHKAVITDFGSGVRIVVGTEIKSKEDYGLLISVSLKIGNNVSDAVKLFAGDTIFDHISGINPASSQSIHLWLEICSSDIRSNIWTSFLDEPIETYGNN